MVIRLRQDSGNSPFSVSELMARVQAVLRRSPQRPTDLAEAVVPGGVVDFARREVRFRDGRREDLSERETELIREAVIIHDGLTYTEEEITVLGEIIDGTLVVDPTAS